MKRAILLTLLIFVIILLTSVFLLTSNRYDVNQQNLNKTHFTSNNTSYIGEISEYKLFNHTLNETNFTNFTSFNKTQTQINQTLNNTPDLSPDDWDIIVEYMTNYSYHGGPVHHSICASYYADAELKCLSIAAMGCADKAVRDATFANDCCEWTCG